MGLNTDAQAAGRFEALYREQGQRMWHSVHLYSGNAEVASDAIAEAFAQAIRRGDAIRDPAAWVWRTAFVIATGDLKARSKSYQLPDRSYVLSELNLTLQEALSKLTPSQRAAVILHYYAGYSLKEIAGVLHSSSSTVGVHLHRARKRLRENLEVSD